MDVYSVDVACAHATRCLIQRDEQALLQGEAIEVATSYQASMTVFPTLVAIT
jgi:hypothetical protein